MNYPGRPFYPDEHGVLHMSRRTPRALTFRSRYRLLRRAALTLPLLVAGLGFAAYVWNEHRWRQAAAADQIEIANLRSRVEVLRAVVTGPRTVCRTGNNARETCVKVIYPRDGT